MKIENFIPKNIKEITSCHVHVTDSLGIFQIREFEFDYKIILQKEGTHNKIEVNIKNFKLEEGDELLHTDFHLMR